jgi:hypothetical protein
MSFLSMRKLSGLTPVCAGLFLSLAACSDSTGPNNLDSSAALRSLSLGVAGLADGASPAAGSLAAAFGAIAPVLEKVNVTIDGTSREMFALGLRESFPPGTCEESLFGLSFPPDPSICTPPSAGVLILLWQSHSDKAPPDRIIVIAADEGTSNFDFYSSDDLVIPALALYLEGQNADNIMFSDTGTLTSHVTATGPTCNIPLPPYAAAATCNISSFDEEGTISFSGFSDTPTASKVVTIPRQTIHGLWEDITQTRPFTPVALGAVTPSLLRRPARGALRRALTKSE